jgi:predicted DNA binding protein
MMESKKNIYIIKATDLEVENFFKAMEILSNIRDLKIQKAEYKECDILSNLTSNQIKILNFAAKFGYYDYPRKITSDELAEKIGISKDTILENLRKAEKRIITKALNGKQS